MAAPKSYRPALRALIAGLVAAGLRGLCLVVARLLAGSSTTQLAMEPSTLFDVLPVVNLIATLVALVGVGYAAIASHRREWGVVLVLAWLVTVPVAIVDVDFFYYSAF